MSDGRKMFDTQPVYIGPACSSILKGTGIYKGYQRLQTKNRQVVFIGKEINRNRISETVKGSLIPSYRKFVDIIIYGQKKEKPHLFHY